MWPSKNPEDYQSTPPPERVRAAQRTAAVMLRLLIVVGCVLVVIDIV